MRRMGTEQAIEMVHNLDEKTQPPWSGYWDAVEDVTVSRTAA